MNIALLFNSGNPKYNGSYGDPIRNTVFGSGIIQASNRHMRVSVGDVLIRSHSKTWEDYDTLTNRTYFSETWTLLFEERLKATFRKATVYALTFENMTEEIASKIHAALASDDSYLGLMEVNYTYGPHLALFHNSMVPLYRVQGTICRVFFSMGEDDGRDEYELEAMKEAGFTDVSWEDRGAHGSIFDDFDTLEHFGRVAAFRQTITPFLKGGCDEASELVMILEDLNPQLFNALGAAVGALERAQHEEDIAQAAISGRRYLEKLADVLFPARAADYNGRKVGREQYRNRIWAFIAENTADAAKLKALGTEVDRIAEEFNAGLHGDQEKERMLCALSDSASLTASILSLNPEQSRNPYFAYEKRMLEFFREVLTSHKD